MMWSSWSDLAPLLVLLRWPWANLWLLPLIFLTTLAWQKKNSFLLNLLDQNCQKGANGQEQILPLAALTVGMVLCGACLTFLSSLAPGLALLLAPIFLWGMTTGPMLRQAEDVLDWLERGELTENLEPAKDKLSQFCKADCSHLSLPALHARLARSCVERWLIWGLTPLFWGILLGPTALWLCLLLFCILQRSEKNSALVRLLDTLGQALMFLPAHTCIFFLKASYQQEEDAWRGGAPGGRWPGVGILGQQARKCTLQREKGYKGLLASSLPPSANLDLVLAAVAWLHLGRFYPFKEDSPFLGPPDNPMVDEDGDILPQPMWEAERLRSLLPHLMRASRWALWCFWPLLLLPCL